MCVLYVQGARSALSLARSKQRKNKLRQTCRPALVVGVRLAAAARSFITLLNLVNCLYADNSFFSQSYIFADALVGWQRGSWLHPPGLIWRNKQAPAVLPCSSSRGRLNSHNFLCRLRERHQNRIDDFVRHPSLNQMIITAWVLNFAWQIFASLTHFCLPPPHE